MGSGDMLELLQWLWRHLYDSSAVLTNSSSRPAVLKSSQSAARISVSYLSAPVQFLACSILLKPLLLDIFLNSLIAL